jgi:hypothetical protein
LTPIVRTTRGFGNQFKVADSSLLFVHRLGTDFDLNLRRLQKVAAIEKELAFTNWINSHQRFEAAVFRA